FDVIRKGEEAFGIPTESRSTGLLRRPSFSSHRCRGIQHPEGRWSLIPYGHPEAETQAMYQAGLLLHRYGIVARELALLDPWLLLRAGKPVLLIEQQGKRLTALASASRTDVAEAVACLPAILETNHGLGGRHKLTVEEWNCGPVTSSAGEEMLAAAGFVRDYQ